MKSLHTKGTKTLVKLNKKLKKINKKSKSNSSEEFDLQRAILWSKYNLN